MVLYTLKKIILKCLRINNYDQHMLKFAMQMHLMKNEYQLTINSKWKSRWYFIPCINIFSNKSSCFFSFVWIEYYLLSWIFLMFCTTYILFKHHFKILSSHIKHHRYTRLAPLLLLQDWEWVFHKKDDTTSLFWWHHQTGVMIKNN